MSAVPDKCLIYFGHPPLEGAGSAIIVLRHLRRFSAQGWKVVIVPDWGHDHALCDAAGWTVVSLPHRRKWWPPFNSNSSWSRRVRGFLWAGHARRVTRNHERIDGVLTYLSAFSDTLSIAAVGFARRYRLPLASLIHDDCRCFSASPVEAARAHHRRQWILERSTRAWFASPELAACYNLRPERAAVLPPIPEGAAIEPASTSDLSHHSPLLVYAGNYWAPQLPVLASISQAARTAGGRLLAVVKDNSNDIAFLRSHSVEWRSPFAKNTEALKYYAQNAAALVVSYAHTTEEMPWTRTSFPSKLVEYCHLGVPIVIVAPEDTATVNWARTRGFPDIYSPDDTVGLSHYISRLREPAFRSHRAAQMLGFAGGEFNPQTIHCKLEASLLTPGFN